MSARCGKIERDVDGFKKIVSESKSFSEVMRKMGNSTSGGNHRHLIKKIKKYNIDVSHFTRIRKKNIINEESVKREVRNSCSIINLAERIGIANRECNTTVYRHLKKIIEKHQLDVSHFSGMLWSKGKTRFNDDRIKKNASMRRNLWEKIFCKDCIVNTHSKIIIELLIETKIKKYKCEKCGLYKWENSPIRLHLDHVNGDNCDNRIENLRLLCPNCHSQTETYCRGEGKGNLDNFSLWYDNMIENSGLVDTDNKKDYFVITIGKRKKIKLEDLSIAKDVLVEKIKNTSCKKIALEMKVNEKTLRRICQEEGILVPDCRSKINEIKQMAIERSRKFHVSKEELEKLVNSQSMVSIGKMFNVSDKAIVKRCMSFGINWRKRKQNNGTVVQLGDTLLRDGKG